MAATRNNCAHRPVLAIGPAMSDRARPDRRFAAFLGDETGAVSLEFTVLLPFFVLLLVFFADAAVIYLSHSEMYSAARGLARQMAVETITTQEEVDTYAASHLFLGGRTYQVQATFGTEMQVTISVPIGEAAIFGLFVEPIIGRQLTASATMRREPMV
jgi:Flp pilus assembly protein TadG